MTEREVEAHQEAFERGVEYEVLRETINIYVATHMDLAYKSGLESAEGQKQLKTVKLLEELRTKIRSENPEALDLVSLALRAGDLQ